MTESAAAGIDQEQILKSIYDFAKEAASAQKSFQKRLEQKEFTTVEELAGEVSDLFSMIADLANTSFQAHNDHYEWSGEVDDVLDALQEEGADAESSLLPPDALKLKSLLLDLGQNLRAPENPSDDIPQILKAKIAESVTFIDGVTVEEVDEDDEEGDEDEDEDAPETN